MRVSFPEPKLLVWTTHKISNLLQVRTEWRVLAPSCSSPVSSLSSCCSDEKHNLPERQILLVLNQNLKITGFLVASPKTNLWVVWPETKTVSSLLEHKKFSVLCAEKKLCSDSNNSLKAISGDILQVHCVLNFSSSTKCTACTLPSSLCFSKVHHGNCKK